MYNFLIADPPEDDDTYNQAIKEYEEHYYDEEEAQQSNEQPQEDQNLGIIFEESRESNSQHSLVADSSDRYDYNQSYGSSVSGLESSQSQMQDIQVPPLDFKEARSTHNKIEKQFEIIVKRQTKLLNDKLFSAKLQEKVNTKFEGLEEKEMMKIVARETEKDLDLRLASDHTRKEKKDYTKKDIEAIIMEIQFLKKRHHEDQTVIKLLKVELRKVMNTREQPPMRQKNVRELSTREQMMTDSKTYELLNNNEQLIKENLELKRLLNDRNDELTRNFLKLKNMNFNLQKEYQKEINAIKDRPQVATSDKSLLHKLKQQDSALTQLRIQLTLIQKQNEELCLKLKEKDKLIMKHKEIRCERNLVKLEEKIQVSEDRIVQIQKEEQEIARSYGLDRQIKLLFPRHHGFLTGVMNVTMIIEELDQGKQAVAFRQIVRSLKPLGKFVDGRLERIKNYFRKIQQKQNKSKIIKALNDSDITVVQTLDK